jgi:hypothetical protein
VTKLTKFIQAGMIAASAAGLAACGGGGSVTAPPPPSEITVAPVLGKFTNGAHVTISKLNGDLLGKADVSGGTGKAIVSIGSHTGPMLVEVTGDSAVTYYDERSKTNNPFTAAFKLRAITPDARAQVGVTSATHAAVAAIEAKNSGQIPAGITAADIQVANAKIETVFGISDILQVPNLVDAATSPTLNIAKPEDKYALQLAAMAKLATAGKTAYDVANDFANDLSDDKLDGKYTPATGPVVVNSATGYTSADIRTVWESSLVSAATELGDDNTKTVVKNDPKVVGPIAPDGTEVVAPPPGNLTDLQKAKAMFSELRTTLNSFANPNKTGFLDAQAKRAAADLNAAVAPQMEKVASSVASLSTAIGVFDDARAYSASNTNGLVAGTNPFTQGSTLVRKAGYLEDVWYGYGTYDYCWTDSATGVTSKVKCLHAGPGSADRTGKKINMVLFELSGSAANQYSYTATRYSRAVSVGVNGALTVGAISEIALAPGSGTASMTVANGELTGSSLNGTLPQSNAGCIASSSNCPTDKVEISFASTALTATSSRYSLSGSVSTVNAADPTKSVIFSIDNGSHIDLDQSAGLTAATIIGTTQTAASKFSGTLTASSFKTNADGQDYAPTSVVFKGSISDTSSGGAGEFLTGKLEASVVDYNLYSTIQPESATNYAKVTVAFTGTVQAPGRPLIKLVLGARATGPRTGTTTANYSYGTVSISGTGAYDTGANPETASITLSNQDGIQLVLSAASNNIIVSKSGTTLATITNGVIKYVDGSSESLM